MKQIKVKTKKDDNENQVIENNIKINIDLKDLEALKPEKKKKTKKRVKKPKDLLDPFKGNASQTGSSQPPRKLGVKIPSIDTDFNPNNTTNMIIGTAIQNALGNRPNFLFNPTAPPVLPPTLALPAPPTIPAITAPPTIPAITAPPTMPALPAPPPPAPPPQTYTLDEIQRLANIYMTQQQLTQQPFMQQQIATNRVVRVGNRGGRLGRPPNRLPTP